MQQAIQEYTPGQRIRAQAVSLHHNGLRMAGILWASRIQLDGLREMAETATLAVRQSPGGKFTGIERRRHHYEELEERLEAARTDVDNMTVSEESRKLWLTINRCQYHCRMIISLMEMYSAEPGRS